MKLYIVRNVNGKFFRNIGYGGYGPNWVGTMDKAKFYTKIGHAKGRVTYFYNVAQYSKKMAKQYPACEILEFTIDPEQAVIINLAEEVSAKAKKRAEKELKEQFTIRAEKLKQLQNEQASLLHKIHSLQTS